MKLRTKITGMGIVLVLLTAIAIVAIAVVQKNILHVEIGRKLSQMTNG